MNIYNAQTAALLLGTSTGTSDDVTSILTNYYSAKLAATATPQSTQSTPATMPTDTVTVPWDTSKLPSDEQSALADAMQTKDFITPLGNYFDQSDVSDDIKKMFIAYQGLTKLDALATQAAADGTSAAILSSLDTHFQSGLSQVESYLGAQTFDQMTLIQGQKLPTVKSTVAIPRNIQDLYTGSIVVNGDYTAAVPGLTGNEQFTINVKKGGATQAINIDLSQMGATPNLDNIAAYINTQLADNGVVTRLARSGSDGEFGLSVRGVETETVSFSSPNADPAIYIAGVSGKGDSQAGQLSRFNDTGGTGASFDFAQRIESVTGTTTTNVTTTAADGTSTTQAVETPTSTAPVNASSTAVDSEGHIYVVGTTNGPVNGVTPQGDQDVYVTKYDSTGQLLWTRLLGASDSAQGFGVATDANGNVVVAGKVTGNLTQGAVGGGDDTFVTKYNSDGEEIFTRQVSPVANDGATSVAIGSDGSIYVGGYAYSAVTSDTTYAGNGDATVTKLSPTGNRVYAREFGTAGSDQTRSVAVANDGNLLVASVEDGHAILRKFDSSNNTSDALWSVDLGDLQGGTIGAIAVDGDAIYVGGSTQNGALDAGGQASIVNPASGGSDGFVSRIDDNGTSASAAYTSYLGTADADQIRGIAVANGAVYATGDTTGSFPGQTLSGSKSGVLAKFGADGTLAWTTEYGGQQGTASGAAVAVDAQGSSVLDLLGLPKGSIDYTQSQRLSANSTVRDGDTFSMSINGKPARSVTISQSDTIQTVATKLNVIFGTAAKATASYNNGAYQLSVTVNAGNSVDFMPGKTGYDALKALGIPAGAVVNDTVTTTEDKPSSTIAVKDLTPLNNFVALGLDQGINLSTKTTAQKAQTDIESAMRAIRLAYTTLTQGKFVAATGSYANSANGSSSGEVPAYLQNQIAGYQAALTRLTAGQSTSSTTNPLLG